MIIEAQQISLSYGANTVLRDVTFRMDERDRVGLVGYNGGGKTTLLNIITGNLLPSGGDFVIKRGATLGYLKQNAGLDTQNTVIGEMRTANDADALLRRMKELERDMGEDSALIDEYESISARYEAIDGYNLEYNIKRILNGMGFGPETFDKRVSVLSGGEKTRLALAKLLIQNPDLLVLDEPTNHLDLPTLEWLEKFLIDYRGAVLIVSHDRKFLDSVCNRILEIQNGLSHLYRGNFSAYMRQKQENETREREVYERTVREAEKLREYAEKNIVRASTSNMAKSRLKMLDRLDMTAPENSEHVAVRFSIVPSGEPYKDVLTVKDVDLAVGGKALVSGIDFVMRRGDRLAVIGPNGAGKSTLLRSIAGKLPPKKGSVRIGGGVKLGIMEQNVYQVHAANPLEYIWGLYPKMSQLEVRNLLASVGFRGEDVFTDAHGLSGGELARLSLARLALEHPNFLLLDEPTNHLDIYSKDILYDALREYSGTLLVVTHDRYLMQTIGCAILLIQDGTARFFESYDAYRAAVDSGSELAGSKDYISTEQKKEKKVDTELEQTKAAVGNAKELRRQRARDRERKTYVENRIEQLESEIYDLQAQLEQPEIACDGAKLIEISEALDKNKQELSELEDEWLECFCD